MSNVPPPPGPPTPPQPPVAPPPPPPGYSYGAGAQAGEPPLDQPYYGAPIQAAITRFWKKYATFSGRASRSEYWWWVLIAAVVNIVLSALGKIHGIGGIFTIIQDLWSLAIIVPTLALVWRRLHDTNRSGLWALAPVIFAIVGAILVIFGAGIAVVSSAHALGLALLLVGVIVSGIGGLVLLILTLLPSNPEGARFDRAY
jgi:uncharacterized membrane protein YhaH (DUF805 family)